MGGVLCRQGKVGMEDKQKRYQVLQRTPRVCKFSSSFFSSSLVLGSEVRESILRFAPLRDFDSWWILCDHGGFLQGVEKGNAGRGGRGGKLFMKERTSPTLLLPLVNFVEPREKGGEGGT